MTRLTYEIQCIHALRQVKQTLEKLVGKQFITIQRNVYEKSNGSVCNECRTQDIIRCGTPTKCDDECSCRFDYSGELKPRPCLNSSKYCMLFKYEIEQNHRGKPNWTITDARKWSKDEMEVAKCFTNPSARFPALKHDGFDCLSLLQIMKNCKLFEDKLSVDVCSNDNILSEAIDIVEDVQGSLTIKVNKEQRDALFASLRNILMDRTYLYHEFDVKVTLSKLEEMLQNANDENNYYAQLCTTRQAHSADVSRKRATSTSEENRSTDTCNLTIRPEATLYFCGWIETKHHRAYRFCMRRIQTAILKCNTYPHDKTEMTIHQGKILFCASQPCHLKELFKSTNSVEKMTLSDIQKHNRRGSPIVFVVASSEQGEIEQFCHSIEPYRKEKKLVCVLIMEEKRDTEIPVVDEKDYGFWQRCSETKQIACCVDDLLERHIFSFYENVLKTYFSSLSKGNYSENDEVLSEAIALHKQFEVPLPDWLQQKTQSVIDVCEDEHLFIEMEPVFHKLKNMPWVFDIVPCTTHVVVKVHTASTDEKTAQHVDAVRNVFEECNIKTELFKIKTIAFTKFTDYKYQSGDELNVGKNIGTLSGFAKMVHAGKREETVAILSGHVVGYPHGLYDPFMKINDETVGNILPRPTSTTVNADISVAKVSKETSQQCDKMFRNEDSERLNAVPLETKELENRPFGRVHIWGARSKPGVAQLKGHGPLQSEVGKYIYLKEDASSQATWQPGDSGAMVLSERYRKEVDQNMLAVGLLTGESVEEDGKKYVVSPLESGFDYLSKDHGATFELYSDDSTEGQ